MGSFRDGLRLVLHFRSISNCKRVQQKQVWEAKGQKLSSGVWRWALNIFNILGIMSSVESGASAFLQDFSQKFACDKFVNS
eukprot:5339430-Amphidinium_carterae.1